MGERLFFEAEIFTESAQTNGIIVDFIEVRADDFCQFEEDGFRRRWWSTVSSVATSESLADISFSSRVRESCLSLVDCGIDCTVYSEAEVVVLMEINII